MKWVTMSMVALALLSVPAWAGSSADPEITDPQNDVNIALALEESEDLPDLPDEVLEDLQLIGDLRDAWVGTENNGAFSISIAVADLPNAPADVENFDPQTALAELRAHFEIKGQEYEARAALSFPPTDAQLTSSYALWRAGSERGALEGSVDVENEVVTFVIPKSEVGAPLKGDRLTHFHVTSHVPASDAVIDYAPNPEPVDPKGDPLDLVGGIADPMYGRDYTFLMPNPALVPAIDVAFSPAGLELEPGEQGAVSISIKNGASERDTVTLAHGSLRGWALSFDKAELVLEPGQARFATLYVVPPDDADGSTFVDLHLISARGADEEHRVMVDVTPPPHPAPAPDEDDDPAPNDDDGPPDAGADAGDDAGDPLDAPPADEDETDEEEDGAPAPGVLALLGAATAAAALAERRRRG